MAMYDKFSETMNASYVKIMKSILITFDNPQPHSLIVSQVVSHIKTFKISYKHDQLKSMQILKLNVIVIIIITINYTEDIYL